MTPLPCPFCGHEPEVGPANPKVDGDAWAYVRCVDELCATHDQRQRHGVQVLDYSNGTPAQIRACAVRRWNRRHFVPVQP